MLWGSLFCRRTDPRISALVSMGGPLGGGAMDGTQATVAARPARPSKRRTANTPALALKLHQYYQLECTRPTSKRLQIWLDEFLRKADAAIDHRAQSAGDH